MVSFLQENPAWEREGREMPRSHVSVYITWFGRHESCCRWEGRLSPYVWVYVCAFTVSTYVLRWTQRVKGKHSRGVAYLWWEKLTSRDKANPQPLTAEQEAVFQRKGCHFCRDRGEEWVSTRTFLITEKKKNTAETDGLGC